MARVLTIVAAFACGAGLTACGGNGSGPDAPVSFQLFGDAEEIAVYRNLADAYTKQTGAKVQIVPAADRRDHLAKLTASFAARRPPDVFLLNYRNLGGYVARGAVLAAQPFVQRAGGLEAAQLYPATVEAFTLAGKLQCVPQNASSLVVYYNRNSFGAAKVPLPAPGWRYDTFLTAARRLTNGKQFGVAIDPNAIRAATFVWSAGGELVDDSKAPTHFTLDTPAARRGLQALVALRARGFAPGRRDAEAQAADERFLAEGAAMLIASRRDVPVLRNAGFPWDVAPFPIIKRPASALHSDGFCLARGPRAQAAWRFVEFATGLAGQRILARGGRTVPSLRSVAESPDFLQSSPPPSNQVFLDQVPTLRFMPSSRNWTRVEEIVDLAVEEAFYGGMSLDAAIKRIERETGGEF